MALALSSVSLVCGPSWLQKASHGLEAPYVQPPPDSGAPRRTKESEVVQASDMLPPEQQAWTCSMLNCKAALPALPAQDHKRAVRRHIALAHPQETPRSLSVRKRLGKPQRKRGVSRAQTAKFVKHRKEKHETHDIFTYRPARATERGCLVYCRRCLSHLQHEDAKVRYLTCDERLARLQTKPLVRTRKRMWWLRLRENPAGLN